MFFFQDLDYELLNYFVKWDFGMIHDISKGNQDWENLIYV